ncbi:MAG: hypothetical protein ACKOC8_01285 [Pirellulales bacterium]
MPIDPCRQWLGIDATDLADPYRALGLAPGESDPLAIVRAADDRLARLRAIVPGPFERAHASILARVAEARDDLLARAANSATLPASSAAPPARPAGGLKPPPPPRSVGAGRFPATAPPVVPPPVRPAVPPPVPPAVPPIAPDPTTVAPEPGDDAPEAAVTFTPRPLRSRRSSASRAVFAVLSLLVVAAAAIAAYVVWPRPGGRRHQPNVAYAATTGEPGQPATPLPTPPDDEARASGERQEAERREAARLEAERRGQERERLRQEQEEEQRRTMERRQAEQREAERKRAATEEAKRTAERQQAEESRRMKAEADRAEADRARAAAAVDRDLRDAYAAVRARDYARAAQTIGDAERKAGEDGDLATRCGRWRLLVDYAAQLADFEQKAIASANEGREYQIGDRLIAIVEITPKTFVYKERGQVKRGARSAMPKAIERAILKQWFAGAKNPANHIYLGIHRLLDDPPDLAKVRSEWETALAGEPATRSIMPLLEDPLLTGDGQ